MLSPQSRDNDEIVQVATMDTISLKDKEIEPQRALPSGYHGSHERRRSEFGLQMDSKRGTFWSIHGNGWFPQIYEKGKVGGGGQGRNRTADASLFRAAYRQS